MMIKRSLEDNNEVENLAMANCLMLLSQVDQSGRVFSCKTCNKEFKSFQALGGHRASHKRPKTTDGDKPQVPMKPKTHECSVCGLEFPIGQALGGHMRRHRDGGEVKSGQLEGKRGLGMDLNLTPVENDLKLWRASVGTALAI
ncbi:hypothetical protein R6Q59_028375 [Mikania micrantha]